MPTTDLRFRFELARTLNMTVGELEKRMDAREFRAWQFFLREEAKERAQG